MASGTQARSRLGTLTAIVHALYTGMIAALAVYCFWRAHILSLSGAADSLKHQHSMLLAGSFIAFAGLIYAITTFGLWRAGAWAFWLSLAVNASIIALFVSDRTGNYQVDAEDWAGITAFSFALLLTLLSALNHRRRKQQSSPPAEAHFADRPGDEAVKRV